MSGDCTSSSPYPESQSGHQKLRVAVLGVCGAGKTTLAGSLRAHGYDARQIGQEHSGVRRLWRRRFDPDLLVYLDASPEAVRRRLGSLPYGDTYTHQRARLELARREANVRVDTSALTPEEVLRQVLDALPQAAARPANPQ